MTFSLPVKFSQYKIILHYFQKRADNNDILTTIQHILAKLSSIK